jgi:hypothetical protein
MKEEKRDYVSIVTASTIRGISVVRINHSTLIMKRKKKKN